MNKNYAVVMVIDREIITSFTETHEQAVSKLKDMVATYLRDLDLDQTQLLENEQMSVGLEQAWVSYDQYNLDVEIFEIK